VFKCRTGITVQCFLLGALLSLTRRMFSAPPASLELGKHVKGFCTLMQISRPRGSCVFIKRQNLALGINGDPLSALYCCVDGERGRFLCQFRHSQFV